MENISEDERFYMGLANLDRIDSHLYLGNLVASRDIGTLNKYDITHILTIDTSPVPMKVTETKNLFCKYVELLDNTSEDLLSHLDETYDFISKGVSEGNVLVHCYFGVSRSASAVIAFLMKRYNIGFSDAFQRVKERRKNVCPNPGFIEQLKLYEEMNNKVDQSNKKYKMFKLVLAAESFREENELSSKFSEIVKPDPAFGGLVDDSGVYRCKACDRIIANKSNQLPHELDGICCNKIVLVEPMEWMKDVTHTPANGLNCPSCKATLGGFSWINGYSCSCGINVTPAFYLDPSKVTSD